MPKTTSTRTTVAMVSALVLTALSPVWQTPSSAADTTARLDTAYGEGGLGLIAHAQGGASTLVDLDDSGRVVTASQHSGGTHLGRLAAAGIPDALSVSWGDAQARALDAQNGRITVVRSGVLAHVDRLLDDGTPDVNFGQNGHVEFPLGTQLLTAAVEGSGRVVLGGSFRRPSGGGYEYSSWLARLDWRGQLDVTFNPGGEQPGVVSSPGWVVHDLALDGDRIVTVERSADGGATRLSRYNRNGTPDTSFGTVGTAAPGPYQLAVAVDAAHRVVATVADSSHLYAVRRWTAAGAVDTSFGRQGTSTGTVPDMPCTGGQADVTVLAGGGVVVTPQIPCVDAVVVVRLTEAGRFDASFAPYGAFQVRAVGPYAVSGATSVVQHADGDLGIGVHSSAMGALRVQSDRPVLPTFPIATSGPSSQIHLRAGAEPAANPMTAFPFGGWSDQHLLCDWDGDGVATLGLYRPSNATWYVRQLFGGGDAHLIFRFGRPGVGDRVLCGDWNGDGVDTPGLFRTSDNTWHLRNSNSAGVANSSFRYGRPGSGDSPLAGDWDRDGFDTPGIFRSSDNTWYLRNSASAGVADRAFTYGRPGKADIPLVGDWDGDEQDTPGIYRAGDWTMHLRNSNAGGPADWTYQFEVSDYPRAAGDRPLSGDWDGDGRDEPTMIRQYVPVA